MTKSDLYIRGSKPQRDAIAGLMLALAERMGGQNTDESGLNIPMEMVMQTLIGDSMHLGLMVGMNTEDPECVVLRIESPDIVLVHEALLECFEGVDIEVDEDVEEVTWPF